MGQLETVCAETLHNGNLQFHVVDCAVLPLAMRRTEMKLEPSAMRKALLSIAFWTLLLSVAPPAFSHHGNAAYDLDKPLTLNGTITEFLWVNPHVQIYFDTRSVSGGMQHWACETVSPRPAGARRLEEGRAEGG